MKNISVIGAGTMGNGIAHVFAQKGFTVSLVDVSPDALTQALSVAEQKIAALSAQGADPAAVELTPEQKAEIHKFQQEKLKIRKNLRDVQRQLNSDVEHLGFVLKVINMAAVPVLLTVVVLMVSWLRRRRARRA